MSKITDQELAQLKDQKSRKAELYAEIGRIESVKHQYLKALDQVLEEQQKTKVGLEDKYGKINIDLKDGSFEKLE